MNWSSLLSPQRVGSKRELASGSFRSVFEQDYDRIIFSHPFRRLQDKTQVHPLPEHDFVHTRLTHSLEVSSVGRSLGKKVGETILQRHPTLADYTAFDFGAVVAAAALAHDLGNPPFGHSGEDSISDFFKFNPIGQQFKARVNDKQWEELIRFEGNAQGFRILNKSQYQGLRLTHATLGAFTKYPCPALFEGRDKMRKSQKKYGYFDSEAEVFASVAESMGLELLSSTVWSRHPLAFLVEAADDICYSIIDLEDGCRLGLVSFTDTVELLAAILKDGFSQEKLNRISGQDEKIGVLRALVIGQLIEECTALFLDEEENILSGKYDRALTDWCASAPALEQIARVSIERIYKARHVVEIEAAGHEVLPGLLQEFMQAGQQLMGAGLPTKYQNLVRLIPVETREAILANPEDAYGMARHMVDFVSGMTDRHALAMYRKIKGISLN